MLAETSLPIIASGGLSSLQDLKDLIQLENAGRQLSGVITGKALYEGKMELPEALDIAHNFESRNDDKY